MQPFVVIGDVSLNEYASMYNAQAKGSKAVNKKTFIDSFMDQLINKHLAFSLITSPLTDEIGSEFADKMLEKNVKVFFPASENRSTFEIEINQNDKKVLSITDKRGLNDLTPIFLKSIQGVFKNVEYIFVSTKLPHNTLKYIFTEYSNRKIVFYCDNETDYKKMQLYANKAYMIIANLNKAKEILSYNNRRPYTRYVDTFLKSGIYAVALVGNGEDVYYGIEKQIYTCERSDKEKGKKVDNISPKFCAGVMFRLLDNGSIHEAIMSGELSVDDKAK